MALKRTPTNNKMCTSFMDGWYEFIIVNHINISDTSFFSMIYDTYIIVEDEEWVEEHKYDESKLKVGLFRPKGSLFGTHQPYSSLSITKTRENLEFAHSILSSWSPLSYIYSSAIGEGLQDQLM